MKCLGHGDAPDAWLLLAERFDGRREEVEEVTEADAALEAALLVIELGIDLDDGFCEGRSALDLLGLSTGLLERQRLVFDHGIELFKVGTSDGLPELLIGLGSHFDSDSMNPFFPLTILIPEA